MSPMAQAALTLACMLGSFFVGKRSGIKSGVQYIFSFMTEKEIEKIGIKIEKDLNLK
jgi:hypothetical protein